MLNIKKLLSKVTRQLSDMQCGRITTLGEVSSNNKKDVTVTFAKAFSKVPNVTACLESSSTAYGFGRMTCGVLSVSTTGFTVRVFNADTSARSPYIQWIAIAK